MVRLGNEEIHVWQVSLDQPLSTLTGSYSLLSEQEKQRARRLKSIYDRHRYVFAHATLRRILAGYIGKPPDEVVFQQGKHGKPFLDQMHSVQQLLFSLSHSHNTALIACAWDIEVGIDIERIETTIDFREVVDHFFAETEKLAIADIEPRHQRERFFQYWTCKEAYLKAHGFGLSKRLDSFSLTIDRTVEVLDEDSGRTCLDWSVQLLPLTNPWVGALAVSGNRYQTSLYRWNGHRPFLGDVSKRRIE